MTDKEAGVTWAKFTAHCNPRFLKVKLTVESKGVSGKDQFCKTKEDGGRWALITSFVKKEAQLQQNYNR